MTDRMILFSLCHATRRLPDGWIRAFCQWIELAEHPETLEYLLAVHSSDIPAALSALAPFIANADRLPCWQLLENKHRNCSVDNWNLAAHRSNLKSKVLISVSDDWFPCPHWDTKLLKLIPDLEGEYAVDVNNGGDDHLMSHFIATRAYLKRLEREHGYRGGMWYPEYESMRIDDDYTDCARLDGVVIPAKHLLFEHRHPHFGRGEWDETYERQHRSEAFALGDRILERRRNEGFKD